MQGRIISYCVRDKHPARRGAIGANKWLKKGICITANPLFWTEYKGTYRRLSDSRREKQNGYDGGFTFVSPLPRHVADLIAGTRVRTTFFVVFVVRIEQKKCSTGHAEKEETRTSRIREDETKPDRRKE